MTTPTSPATRGLPRQGCWMTIGIVIILLAIAGGVVLARPASTAAPALNTTTVTRGTVIATITGSGTVAAVQELDIPFQANGIVTEVLVQEGDTVTAGQTLARVDDREVRIQIANAEAALAIARTKLDQIKEGNAKQADIAAQQASVRSAQAQLRQAQAQLEALRHPSASSVSTAEYNVRQAEISLQATRDNSSAQKTKAEQDLQRAAESLRQAQSKYATAQTNWEWVQAYGTDPITPRGELTDGQKRQYYDQLVQAETALRQAEQALTQAQVTLDNARQQEITNVQQAEAKLADARQQWENLGKPSRSDLAQRQASVDQAQASVNQAQANLAKLTGSGTQSDIMLQELAVTQAELSIQQAKLKLEQTTLKAPFGGIITAVNIVPGSNVGGTQPAFSLVDRSTLHADVVLNENDVAKVQLGQMVDVAIDALKDWQTQGSVSYIAPAGVSNNGVVTYKVRVNFPDSDERVKIGMTANLSITTATKEQALLVPNTALLPKGAGRVVQVPNPDGTIREVDVQTGLTDGTNTEIISGLREGDTIVATPGVQRQPQGGIFGRP